MVESGTRTRHFQLASMVVSLIAAAAASYLLLSDDSSNWWDWLMGCALGVFTLYGIRGLFQRAGEDFAPAWRAGDWHAVVPFVLPLYLVWWSEDRGSRLAWLGWGLLAAAVLVQVTIWRLERSDGGVSRQEPSAP